MKMKTTKIENYYPLRLFSKKTKKAQLFNISLVFLTITVLTMALFILKPHTTQDYFRIGPRQTAVIEDIHYAEKVLLYIDQSAKLSVQQAQEEHVRDPSKSQEYYIDKNLQEYLSIFPDINLTIEYEYSILDNAVIGIAKENIEIYTLSIDKEIKDRIKYSFNPSFNVPIK